MIKRYYLLLLFFATCFTWVNAQPYNVTVGGYLWETGTLAPIPNHDVYVYYDSAGGYFHWAVAQTDVNGAWSDIATSIPPSITSGTFDVWTYDCNSNYVNLGTYTYSALNNNFMVNDTICAPSASNCNANFNATPVFGSTAFNFTDWSTSGIPSASVNSWLWDFGDGGTSTQQHPTHAYNVAGPYRVCLTIGTTAGCTSTFCDTLTIGGGGGSCSAFFGMSSNGCTYTVYDSSWASAGVAAQVWDFGDGTTATGALASHTYTTNGTYQVCLTIYSNDSCIDTYCNTVTVNCGGPSTCNAYFGYTNQNCAFAFYDTSYAAAGIAAYWWDFGDGSTGTGPNPTHTYAANGTYQVCLTIYSNDSCISTQCYNVTCGNSSNCQAGFYWYPDSSGQYSIIVVNSSTGSNLSYQWSFGDGTGSSLQYPSHVYPGAGIYLVCLTVSNGPVLGCSSTYCDSIVVLNRMSVPFSINVVSPATGVAQPSDVIGMQLSPNPAQHEVRLAINLANQGEGQVRLIDVQGRTIQSLSLGYLDAGLHQQTLDLSQVTQGIYMVELMLNGQRTVQKLIVSE